MKLIAKPLCIDRLEMSYRFGEDNLGPLDIVRDSVTRLLLCREARRLKPRYYPNCSHPCQRIAISLFRRPKIVLVVETGVPSYRGKLRPYAKFEFNVQRLARNDLGRLNFHRIMNELLPGGGYNELCQDGKVVYAEFAADFSGLVVSTFDACSPRMQEGGWVQPSSTLETINLNDGKKYREYAFTIYQKNRQEWEVHRHLLRGDLLRVEAKRRFNRTPRYRNVTLAGLAEIANPFGSLGIYERSNLATVFCGRRDRDFLDCAQSVGLQTAIASLDSAQQERVWQRLTACHVDWWNPEQVWHPGIEHAVSETLNLGA